MARRFIIAGSASQSADVFLQDRTSGDGVISLTTDKVKAAYRIGSTGPVTTFALVGRNTTAAWVSGGWAECSSVNTPGIYTLDVPDASIATTPSASYFLQCSTAGQNFIPVAFDMQIVSSAGADIPVDVLRYKGQSQTSVDIGAMLSSVNSHVTSADTVVNSVLTKVTSIDTNVTSILNKVTSIEANTTGMVVKLTSVDTNVTSLVTRLSSVNTNVDSVLTKVTSIDTKASSIITAFSSVAADVWNSQSSSYIVSGSMGQGNYQKFSGTAAAGGAATITLPSGASTVADFYNNDMISITAGAGAGQSRFISDYSTALVATVSDAWFVQPTTTSVFYIQPFPPSDVTVALAAIQADTDNIDTNVSAIKAQTDLVTFSTSGGVDANIASVNDVTVTGTGSTSDTWGP